MSEHTSTPLLPLTADAEKEIREEIDDRKEWIDLDNVNAVNTLRLEILTAYRKFGSVALLQILNEELPLPMSDREREKYHAEAKATINTLLIRNNQMIIEKTYDVFRPLASGKPFDIQENEAMDRLFEQQYDPIAFDYILERLRENFHIKDEKIYEMMSDYASALGSIAAPLQEFLTRPRKPVVWTVDGIVLKQVLVCSLLPPKREKQRLSAGSLTVRRVGDRG